MGNLYFTDNKFMNEKDGLDKYIRYNNLPDPLVKRTIHHVLHQHRVMHRYKPTKLFEQLPVYIYIYM